MVSMPQEGEFLEQSILDLVGVVEGAFGDFGKVPNLRQTLPHTRIFGQLIKQLLLLNIRAGICFLDWRFPCSY